MTNTLAELCAEYRARWDELDNLDAMRKEITGAMAKFEAAIRAAMEDQGLTNDGDKTSVAGLTITRRVKWRAVYEPDKWSGIVAELVRSGNEHLIQRRLTDTKVMELVDNGVALPDGLSVEPWTDLDMRRV